MKKIITIALLFLLVGGLGACLVPKKKFLAMQYQRDSLQNSLNVAHLRIDSLSLALQAQKDTVKMLREEVADLKSKLATVNEQYATLSENYKQLRANSTDEIKKLIKELENAQSDLAAREKRLQEVEEAMAKRDAAVKALRDKLQKALLGFNKSGLW
jgi:chemotaxis protein MotB